MNVRTLRLAAIGSTLLTLKAMALVPLPVPLAPPAAPPGENIITCGAPPLDETYCYGPSDSQSWLYTSSDGTTSLALIFSAGQIESDNWDHLTIYDGPDNSYPILFTHAGVFSTQDLTGVLAISTGPNIFMQMSSDASVSCSTGSFTSWAWQVGCLDCVQPQATFAVDLDCALGIFNVVVDVTAMGSDPSIDITNTGGAPVVTATATGSYTVGPFAQGTTVTVVLENELNSLCNVSSGPLTNYPCPIISCGPDQYSYCYGNSETFIQIFQGNNGFPVRLQFNSGGIYQFDGDLLTIYDGLNDQAPIIYQGTGTNGDLSGMFFTSSNPDFALTLKLTSTQFTSCSDGIALPWDYVVGCLDCVPPTATAGQVTTDCDGQIFSISVEISDLGTDPQVEIANDQGYPPTVVSAPGSYTAGPFPVGVPITLTVVNDANALCNVDLGVFENAFCPLIIPCANPALDQSYCYLNSDSHQWLYQDNEGLPLALDFSAGTIESVSFDHLDIYDGTDNTGNLLFTNTFGGTDLSTLPPLIAPSGSIYMVMSSDGSVSCATGNQTMWQWTVDCLDCSPVTATVGEITTDCDAQIWSVSVDVTAMGNDPSVDLTNDVGLPPTVITAPGTYTAGPFPVGTPVTLTLVNDSNSLCNVNLGVLENAFCPIIIDCADSVIYEDSYCYQLSDFHHWLYTSTSGAPLVIQFLQGTIESASWDHLSIYDGSDNTGTLLWTNGFLTTNLTDTTVVSIGDSIYMEMSSDPSISCSSGSMTEWIWNVYCLDCTPPTATFEMVPDCIHNGFSVDVNVTDLGQNTTDLLIRNTFNGDTLTGVHTGSYTVGPFPLGATGNVVVQSVNTPLCKQVSPAYFLAPDSCVTLACDAVGQEYCYSNADTAWFVYASGTSDPITVTFEYGQLLVNDYIQVYNGLDTSAQIVYMGNQGGQIGGLSISSSNPANALTVLVISSQAGSCSTGQASPALYWSVSCGLVGENEFTVDHFAMFPNPTTGELYVRTADGLTGLVSMDVLDMTGRLVMSERFSANAARTERFDLGVLANGTYAVRLYTDDWSKTEQLQVAH